MIFITVGTHEQPFNRLIETIDNLKANNVITDDVIIQTGYSTYKPKYCEWFNILSYDEMKRKVNKARIVITHGGPSSFIMPLQIGKIPIVVPRKQEFNEHVNNHQVEFSRALAERMGTILVVENVEDLEKTIINYEKIISSIPVTLKSNNKKFCLEFEKIVDEIV